MKTKTRAFDVLGNIAIVNFPKEYKKSDKIKFAKKLLEQKPIKSVLEKKGKVKGRLRKITTKHLAGEKTKEVLYKENDCIFRFNIDTTYFSPRLSNERKEIASKIKKGDSVLVMFAGVAPFSIVIAKNSKAKEVVSNEINREANKYAKLNVELNKVKNKVKIIQGDIKRVVERLGVKKFDVIVMPRPRLKETFLKQAFMLSKSSDRISSPRSKKNSKHKATRIYYYDFCKVGEEKLIINKIKQKAKKFKKKIKILRIKSAGEIAPYKIRVRVDFQII